MAKTAKGTHFKEGGSPQGEQLGRDFVIVASIVVALVAGGHAVATRRAGDVAGTTGGIAVELPLAQGVAESAEALAEEGASMARLATWRVDPESIDTGADAACELATSERGVVSRAPLGFSQTAAAMALDQAISAFEDAGYVLGFALVDVETGRTLSYNADEPRYPASSIKAAFCAMVYENNGPVSEGLVASCLVESSNEAYHSLIRSYGLPAFSSWLEPMAPEAAANATTHYYPWISPNEFLAVWQEIYRYGTSDEPGAAELVGHLSQTNHSAWGDLLRGEWEVWSKPGWYPTTRERATNDCGVIRSDCGDYVVVVMSDAPEDFGALMPVLDALNVAHGKMCGGSTDSRL